VKEEKQSHPFQHFQLKSHPITPGDDTAEMQEAFNRLLRTRRATVYVAIGAIANPLVAVFFCCLAVATANADIPLQQDVEHLSKQGIEYWFVALAVLAILSWSFIVKWLINQLESQRAAHAAITDRLINYMQEDHAKMMGMIEGTTKAIDRTNHLLEKMTAVRPVPVS
jgi:hypothetical protein